MVNKYCSWCKRPLNLWCYYQLQGEDIICCDCADNIERELILMIRKKANRSKRWN